MEEMTHIQELYPEEYRFGKKRESQIQMTMLQ